MENRVDESRSGDTPGRLRLLSKLSWEGRYRSEKENPPDLKEAQTLVPPASKAPLGDIPAKLLCIC